MASNSTQVLSRANLEKKYPDLSERTELLLDHNEYDRIDAKAFESLGKLENLWLNGNRISAIEPKLFGLHLQNLKELSLRENRLTEIPTKTFASLANLERLELNQNEIGKIESDSFAGLSNLKELILCNNKLEKLLAKTFEPLKKLEYLFLNHNQLVEVDSETFVGLASLKLLTLNDNKLKSITRETLETFQSSSLIGLIALLNNNMKTISFFNPLIVNNWSQKDLLLFYANKWHDVWSCGKVLADNGGFKSDFREFINQFTPKSRI